MAFQIADDMLDYTGSEVVTGKPTGLDLREHKVTLPLVGAMREMSEAERARVRHFFGVPQPSDEEVRETVELVRRTGGLEYARVQAMKYAESAESALDGLSPGPAVEALRESVVYAIERSR